MRKCNI